MFKRYCALFAGLTCAALFTACSKEASTASTEIPSEAELTEVTFTVKGMTCEGCVKSITQGLQRQDGVAECEVSLEGHSARVKYVDGMTSSEKLLLAVEELGYTASLPGKD